MLNKLVILLLSQHTHPSTQGTSAMCSSHRYYCNCYSSVSLSAMVFVSLFLFLWMLLFSLGFRAPSLSLSMFSEDRTKWPSEEEDSPFCLHILPYPNAPLSLWGEFQFTMRLFLLACVLLQSPLLQTPPRMPLNDFGFHIMNGQWVIQYILFKSYVGNICICI